MKRTSLFSAAALAVGLCLTAQPAGAIDPAGGSTRPSAVPQQFFNPTPGSTGFGFNDPFFNAYNQGPVLPGNSGSVPTYMPGFGTPFPGSGTIPGSTFPGTQNPGTTVPGGSVPNPGTGGSVLPGRTRTDGLSGTPIPGQSLNPGSLDPRLGPTYVPPGQSPLPASNQRRWRLGVYSQDLDTGVKIMQVVPNGAAARASLEPEDVIVAVNGYQVGYVNGQLYDCSTEFERHATRDGWVRMLIQNRRDRTLVNVPVQLEPRFQVLTGSISLENRRQLPPDAVILVELREIVRQGAEPVTVASGRVENIGNAYPIPFQIDFDPVSIDTRRNYVVAASIHSRNRVLYQTVQNFPVFQPNSGKNVALSLAMVEQPQFNPNLGTGDKDAQIAQIVNYFRTYLGRDPKDSELIAFLTRLESNNYAMKDVQLDLLGHNAFFNRCDANAQSYIERLHEFMVGRPPSAGELQYWMARYDASGGVRRVFVSEFQDAVGIQR